MTNAFSWQNSVSLCPFSFCTPRTNLPVTPGISWLPTFAFQFPMMKRTSFFDVSSRRSCRSSWNHSTSASSALWLGHRLGLLWYRMEYEWTEIILSFLRLHPSTAFGTLVDCDGYTIFSKGFLPTVVDIMFIWVKFTHSSPFGGFPGSSVGKESTCHAGDPSSMPGSGRSPEERNGNPPQHSCLENLIARGVWRVTNSLWDQKHWTWLTA